MKFSSFSNKLLSYFFVFVGVIYLLKELDLKLVKIIDTHIHADHVTGASKLKDISAPVPRESDIV